VLDNLEYIEAFFTEGLSAERKKEFEQRIASDPVFAEEVAFYLSLKQVASEERNEEREKFKHLYKRGQPGNHTVKHEPALLRRLWPWAAAAAVLVGIFFGWLTLFQPVSPARMADRYITKNFQNLPIEMDTKLDSLQAALNLYNNGKPEQALKQLESLALTDSSSADAKKYAGIVSLQLGQYEKAINYFSQLSSHALHVNPGKFFHAVTLMKRDQPGDNETAKQLLQQVVENDLVGKKDAEKWLKKW